MSSVLDQSDAAVNGRLSAPRPLAQILAFEDEDPRFPRMQETWLAFGGEMSGQVRAILESSRSPAEMTYGVGVVLHNYFRTHGIPLTTYELRALAAELMDQRAPLELVVPEAPPPQPPAPEIEEPPSPVPEPVIQEAQANGGELVSFVGKEEERARAWAGEDSVKPAPAVAEAALAVPPSTLVNVIGREAASFDRLLEQVVEIAKGSGGAVDRDRARVAIDAAIAATLRDQQGKLPTDLRERLALAALSEICGLGLIDRLWADRSIRAVYVDGPEQVHVERNGVRERAPQTFRSAAHLLDLAQRLARPRSTGVAEFQLRDGGSGLVIFPPAAPAGPVLTLRRGEPGNATLDRLIAAQMLDRRIAALLRIAARARLNILVVGPEGAGKTALLAAIARDLAEFRVVTLAQHREFRWPSAAKVELVAQADGPSFGELMVAGARLQPDMLVMDSPPAGDVPALAARVARGARGTLVALRSDAVAAVLARSMDLVICLGRSADGVFRVVSVQDTTGTAIFVHDRGGFHRSAATPAFAGRVREAGYGEAFSGIFR